MLFWAQSKFVLIVYAVFVAVARKLRKNSQNITTSHVDRVAARTVEAFMLTRTC